MIDRRARAELRARTERVLDDIETRAARDPAAAPMWQSFAVQLRALLAWTKDDRLPTSEELERITVGNMAIHELGETFAETPPDLQDLREELMIIQDDVMSFYAPFP
jgi:hypothetical protein